MSPPFSLWDPKQDSLSEGREQELPTAVATLLKCHTAQAIYLFISRILLDQGLPHPGSLLTWTLEEICPWHWQTPGISPALAYAKIWKLRVFMCSERDFLPKYHQVQPISTVILNQNQRKIFSFSIHNFTNYTPILSQPKTGCYCQFIGFFSFFFGFSAKEKQI